jgi:hypothetical protein
VASAPPVPPPLQLPATPSLAADSPGSEAGASRGLALSPEWRSCAARAEGELEQLVDALRRSGEHDARLETERAEVAAAQRARAEARESQLASQNDALRRLLRHARPCLSSPVDPELAATLRSRLGEVKRLLAEPLFEEEAPAAPPRDSP